MAFSLLTFILCTPHKNCERKIHCAKQRIIYLVFLPKQAKICTNNPPKQKNLYKHVFNQENVVLVYSELTFNKNPTKSPNSLPRFGKIGDFKFLTSFIVLCGRQFGLFGCHRLPKLCFLTLFLLYLIRLEAKFCLFAIR